VVGSVPRWMDAKRLPTTRLLACWRTALRRIRHTEPPPHPMRPPSGSSGWPQQRKLSAADRSRYAEPNLRQKRMRCWRHGRLSAVRKGEAFDIATGEPLSMVRHKTITLSWYEFACEYVEVKWPTTSPNHRMGTANVLMSVTVALLADRMPPDEKAARAIRSALLNWGFNARRGSEEQSADVTERLEWVARNSPPLTQLLDSRTMRPRLTRLSTKLDGSRASARTAAWRRSVLSTALNYAMEQQFLESNPVGAVKWTSQKTVEAVDRRSVANPSQARALLAAVAKMPRSGKRMVAFFGAMYYLTLRPEEAANLRRANLDLPKEGWGWITLEQAAPEVGRQWSDSDRRREDRELKHRAPGESRRVPCPPALTRLFWAHLDEFGTDSDGRLFRGERGAPLGAVTYTRLWHRARKAALTPEQTASSLARRPYDLRHAAVSTWLNGGVAQTQVAEWAGHSVAVLLRIYAKCLDGQEDAALRKIDVALS
jgi:site-specific recombinase XerD